MVEGSLVTSLCTRVVKGPSQGKLPCTRRAGLWAPAGLTPRVSPPPCTVHLRAQLAGIPHVVSEGLTWTPEHCSDSWEERDMAAATVPACTEYQWGLEKAALLCVLSLQHHKRAS